MKETINRLSRELNLPPDVVEKAYKAYWKFIRYTIGQIPLKKDMDEAMFDKLKVNFNIPNLGKLACTHSKYTKLRKRNKVIQGEHVEHKED